MPALLLVALGMGSGVLKAQSYLDLVPDTSSHFGGPGSFHFLESGVLLANFNGGVGEGPFNAVAGTQFFWYPAKFSLRAGSVSSTQWSNLNTGLYSFSFGSDTFATGSYTTAYGANTSAQSYFSFVLGTYNVGGGSKTTWVATDPIFEIGNGTSSTPSDAMVVYKNGNAILQGVLQVAPGGDIPMYTGL